MNGKIRNSVPKETKLKYENEARLDVGVVHVSKLNGKEEGRQCKAFDYTKKTVVTKAVWKRTLWDKITCVKSLRGGANKKSGVGESADDRKDLFTMKTS